LLVFVNISSAIENRKCTRHQNYSYVIAGDFEPSFQQSLYVSSVVLLVCSS